ncbi:P-loop containing nucleoside triphosphate hydrolase protein [Xylogone sp. PMI_703]|nr:P-loop containing nucleoside triphosphate hydrolase protein [Xylogone sp. PMI_703]
MRIEGGQDIGICGHSGSGKCSLMLALFRMISIDQGRIAIDGKDITSVVLGRLSDVINAVHQEPFFPGGSVRLNSDPYGRTSDEEIEQALSSVCLATVVAEKGRRMLISVI